MVTVTFSERSYHTLITSLLKSRNSYEPDSDEYTQIDNLLRLIYTASMNTVGERFIPESYRPIFKIGKEISNQTSITTINETIMHTINEDRRDAEINLLENTIDSADILIQQCSRLLGEYGIYYISHSYLPK